MRKPPPKQDPDPKLIKKAQEGDRESLEALLELISPTVRQWAMAHTGDSDSASDLCQEVFLLLLRKLSSYRGDSRFTTWLFSVTRNQAMEAVRRKGRREEKMSRLKVEIGGRDRVFPQAEEGMDRKRMGDLVSAFVRDLPARQREVFQMSDLQGLTSPEIGDILDINPVSVRAALLKARKSLRRRILEEHPEFAEEYLT